MGRAIAPGTTELMRHSSVGQQRKTLGSERGTSNIAAEPFEFVALVVLNPDSCVKREPLPVRAQLARYEAGSRVRLDTESGDGSPGIRAQRDTALYRCRRDHR